MQLMNGISAYEHNMLDNIANTNTDYLPFNDGGKMIWSWLKLLVTDIGIKLSDGPFNMVETGYESFFSPWYGQHFAVPRIL